MRRRERKYPASYSIVVGEGCIVYYEKEAPVQVSQHGLSSLENFHLVPLREIISYKEEINDTQDTLLLRLF